ncbi:hypothetical protein Btru_045539, partial [Bulinus truncatus]
MQGDLIAQSEQIIYSLQQIIQSWFDPLTYYGYRYLVTSYDIQHSMSSTSIFFNVISVYGSQYIDYYLQQFIYNHFIISTLRITVNGTDYEISSFKVYETPEEARLDINPRKKCDYGMYAENQHCVACEQGKSTLVKGANSRNYCTEICLPGYYFRLDKMTCEFCPNDTYWSEADRSCHICPYTLFNTTSCTEGEVRTVNNPLINIEMNVTIRTPKCMKNDSQYFNNIDERELVRLMVSSQSYYYSRLCIPYVGCDNIITNYVGQEICIPDPSCTANATCTSYHTRIHLGVYHIGTYSSSVSERNNHDQSSVDILMRTLYDTTQLYQWIPLMNYQAIRIVQPYDIKITSIEDVTKQVLYITHLYNYHSYIDQLQIYNSIFESIPEFIRAFFLNQHYDQYGRVVSSNYEIWLHKDVDDPLIEKIAKAMVLSHEYLGGNLIGPLLLYKTIQEREDGKMAINWKDVINSLSVAQYFCNGGNFITSDYGYMSFDCVDTCGNWTWGENCTGKCNCTKETTLTCEKWQGSCICAPNFEGSSCEKLIDHCLLYSACGPNSECINTMTSYECKCHEGYKKNPYNPNICEACTGLTFGTECNSTCSCHAENTQFCDNVSGNCTCKSGFQSASCDVDINECKETVSPCSENLHCYNTYGSYLFYLRLTLMQGDLIAQSEQIIYNLQQIIQSWFDPLTYYGYRYLVTSYDIQHSMSSTSIFFNVISVYGSQYIDYYLQQFIYNHFISSTLRITVNGTDYEISSFKVYETPEEARLDMNPRKKCDYGMYAENQHCVACEQGKSTLVKGANSRNYCTEICLPGYYFRLDKMTCEFCPNDTYWSEADRSCHICPYTLFNTTSCTEGEVRTVNNPLINIEMNVTIRTPKCMKNDSQYFNNIDERELVRLMVSSQSYYYSRLCIPYVGCDNIITNYVGQEICIPDPSCTANATCTSYHTRIHLGVYHIGTYSSSVSERNNHDQSSVDILMRTLYDTTQLYQWIPLMNYQAIRIVQPYDIKITSIEDVTKQVLYITHLYNYHSYIDQLQIYNSIFESIPEFIRAFFLNQHYDQYGRVVSSNYEIWLLKDVDDLLTEKIAKAMVLSHVNLGGNLKGPLLLYKTIQEREDGKMAINWKDVINSLSVAQYFCNGGNFITSDYGYMSFACVDTCGNWTWGENCTGKCNCTKETTLTCEKWQGSCICAPNFEGSSCEKLIDHCLLYSACGPNSECINTMTSYECKCHEGYKKNPYNPNICEACTGLTFGTECNSTCSCHAENTQFCDNVSGNCTCKSGFQSASCDVDINECKETVSPCSESLHCYNTYGSYLFYLRLTLMQGDLIAQSEQIIYSLQQIIQSWFDPLTYYGYRYLVTSYDIQHSMSSTSIFFNVISVYGSQYIDYYLQQFIYNHFIISTLRITVNGTDYEISSFKVYETPEEARLDINPRKKCDYGMYAENEHCVACEEGKSTLVKGANSHSYCTEICLPGYYFRLDKMTCELCPNDTYWSEADRSCHICPYTVFNATSCTEGEGRTVSNPLINIEMNITIRTPKCMNNFSQYYNNIDERELVRLMVSSQSYYYSRLCLSYVGCDNIITNYVGEEICIPDPSCTANATCTSYSTRIHLGVYHIGTYLSSMSERNYHDQSSVDILMRTLYDTTQLYQWIPLMNPFCDEIVHEALKLERYRFIRYMFVQGLGHEAFNNRQFRLPIRDNEYRLSNRFNLGSPDDGLDYLFKRAILQHQHEFSTLIWRKVSSPIGAALFAYWMLKEMKNKEKELDRKKVIEERM